MKLVLLAAGHGTRFGGLKQIAPVGPGGEAIMDYTVRFAEQCGFDGVVLVVREEIRAEIESHVQRRWSRSLPVETVVQPSRPGTAYAVACTRSAIDGPFAVANADDLYEPDALGAIRGHFAGAASASGEHVLVAYRLTRTVLTSDEVKRGVCRISRSGHLERIDEQRVRLRGDGRFDAVPLAGARGHHDMRVLEGSEPVSMNLWGFAPSIFDHLEAEISSHEPAGPEGEILLPVVVGDLVRSGQADVRVVTTASRCYGVTHRDDVRLVREHLEIEYGAGARLPTAAER